MPPTTTTITTRLNPNNSQCIPFAQVPCAARVQGRDDDQTMKSTRLKTTHSQAFCSLESIRRIVANITVVTVARPPIQTTIPSR